MMLAAIGIALWQAEQDNRAIMEARERQEAVQGGIPKSKPEFPIDINTATARELEFLPGIGETYSREIVRLREEQGPFTTVDDLLQISGIGEKTVDGIRGLTRVSLPPDPGASAEGGDSPPGDDSDRSSSE
jgi:competence protein ComEA